MGRDNFSLQAVVRPNIWALKPYRCARDDYSTGILLDANENSYGTSFPLGVTPAILPQQAGSGEDSYTDRHLERYPDPHQADVKASIAAFRGLSKTDCFFLGVGSDESLDLIIRVFCTPAKDKVLICPPTYGMYSVCAQINDVEVVKVPLDVEKGRFQMQLDKIKATVDADPSIKVIFLCSPGNPTGTLLNHADIKSLLEYPGYNGVIVVDEAYIDFCPDGSSVCGWVGEYPNLIVTQTLSKSFGLAGIRLGVAISSPEIAQIFNNTKAPYNISTPTSILARAALAKDGVAQMQQHVTSILAQRDYLITELVKLPGVGPIIGGNHANFVLAPILGPDGTPSNDRAFKLYKTMAESEGVVVRYRGSELGCEGCLRVTVGTEEENRTLLEKLRRLLQQL
ncbi:pyridoxal phosphate-dependent transferase [Powellomyces hirtus]|nr:pyridoxal phosphate-dependent transferase [Powellomyces hirtus]